MLTLLFLQGCKHFNDALHKMALKRITVVNRCFAYLEAIIQNCRIICFDRGIPFTVLLYAISECGISFYQ